MVKHIVVWKLKDQAEGADKKENARRMKEMIEALRGKVPGIRELEVGFNFNPAEQAGDVSLYSAFDSRADLDTYQNHPEHAKVGEFVRKVAVERRVSDYEV